MMVLRVIFPERLSPEARSEALKTQITINLKKHKQDWRIHSCGIDAEFLETTMSSEAHVMVECGFLNHRNFNDAQYCLSLLPTE